LPEPLDALDGRAAMLLPLLILCAGAAVYAWLTVELSRQNFLLNPFLLVLSGGILLYQLPWLVSAARQARERGFSWRQVIGALLRQPTWWYVLWYPRRFRRAGDVWDWLPRPFRWWRLSVTLIVADCVLLAPMFLYIGNNPDVFGFRVIGRRVAGAAWFLLVPVFESLARTLAVLLPLALLSLALCARHVLAMGLDVYQRRRITSILLSQPTSQRSVWKRPELARVLLPSPPRATGPTEPRLPREFADALARDAAAVTGERRRELERVAEEARGLVTELEAMDAEIARIARDADPEEAAHLRQRLEALGPESEAEGEERRQMRRLLSEQAGLLAKVAERVEQARARRDERAQALRELWRSARTEAARTLTRAGEA